MPITQERFDAAEETVEQGVKAALACGKAHMKAVDTLAELVDGLRDDDLLQEALLELLGVAVMMLALERAIREATDV